MYHLRFIIQINDDLSFFVGVNYLRRQRRINFNREKNTILFTIRLHYAGTYIYLHCDVQIHFILLIPLILLTVSLSFSSIEPWIRRVPFRCFREQLRMVFTCRNARGQAKLDRSTAIVQCMTFCDFILNIFQITITISDRNWWLWEW